MWSTLPPPFTLTGDDLSGGSSGHRRGSNRGDSAAKSCAIMPIIARSEHPCVNGHFAAPTEAGFAALAAVFPPIRHRKSQVVPATLPPAAATPWASTPLVSIPMVWIPFLWNAFAMEWIGMQCIAIHPFHTNG